MNFSSVSRPRTLIALAFLTLAGAGCNKDSAPATDTSSALVPAKMASAPTASGSKAPATMDSASGAAFVSPSGYEVTPPAGWTTLTGAEAALVGADKPEVKFAPSDGAKAEVSVLVTSKPDGVTLDILKSVVPKQLAKNPGSQLQELSDLKVGGEPAFQQMMTKDGTKAGPLKSRMIFVLHNDKFFTIKYVATEADYAKQDGAFQNCLDSFKWK